MTDPRPLGRGWQNGPARAGMRYGDAACWKAALGFAAFLCCVLVALALHPALDLDVARLFYLGPVALGHGRFIGDARAGLVIRYTFWSLPFVLFAATVLAAYGAKARLVASTLAPSRRALASLTLSLALGPRGAQHVEAGNASAASPQRHAVRWHGRVPAVHPHRRRVSRRLLVPVRRASARELDLGAGEPRAPPWRGVALAGAVLRTLATCLARMAYGAHFPSDVTSAMLIMVLILAGLRTLISGSPTAGSN